MRDCEELIKSALVEGLDTFKIERDDNSCKVLTPLQHTNGDHIRIWVQEKKDDRFIVRDYGETYAMLELYGVSPKSDSRKEYISHIENQFGLESEKGEILLRASRDELGSRILDAIQAMQATTHLMYTHQTQQPSRFKTKVKTFLSDVGYDYEEGFTVEGSTHARKFDFSINHREPTVLLDTIHSGSEYGLRTKVDSVMVNWYEIQDMKYDHGVVIDNIDGVYERAVVNQLVENLDYFFKWEDKDQITQEIPIEAR